MAQTAAELIAYLRLHKGQFDRSLGDAHRDMGRSEGKFREWSKGMGVAAAETITAGAVGTAALAAHVFKTGVNYNGLQQKSRAALTTIFDDGAKANFQMDKLDDFAANSPFSKDVFIRAQQQLLGFGMEAEDVVPTLGAIEDSVAAVGGSDQDILEISNVLAKVTGSGKITAETLNELGIRGINAADIIGEQMGKSGEQIRTEITAGTLDADDAISALTTGMTEKFGGAAANVKETWDGATDRIRAATRDIGAEIAKPFVDPNGGGRAIDWANDFADVLRALEDQLPGMVSALDNRLSPAFDNFRITMKDAKDAIDNWDVSDFETTLDRVSGHLPGIAGLSGALFALGTQNVPVIGRLTGALGPLPAALGAAALASPEMREGLKDIFDAGKPLIDVVIDLAGVASGVLTEGLGLAGDALSLVADIIGPVVEWFVDLPGPIRNAATAALVFNAAGGPTSTILQNMTTGVGNVLGGLGGWVGAFEGAFDSTDDFRAAVSLAGESIGTSAKTGLRGAANGIMGLFGGPWGIALMGATALVTMWANEQKAARERADELRNSLDEQTGAITDSTEASVIKNAQEEDMTEALDKHEIALGNVTAAILGEEEAYDKVKDSIIETHRERGASQEAAENLMEKSKVVQYIEEQRDVIDEQKRALEEAAEAERIRQSRLDEGERSHERFVESLKVVVDETANLNDRVAALNAALDELNGATTSQEERDRELANTQRNLAGFFDTNAEAIAGMDESLIDMTTGMPSHTEEGNKLNEILKNMGEDADKAAIAAYDLSVANGDSAEKTQESITAAYKPYIDTLKDMEAQGYLSSEEVDALTTSIIGVPEITSYLITHNDSVTKTQKDVLGLISDIESTPDGDTHITDNKTSQKVVDELIDLGYEVERLPDGKVEVKPVGISKASEIVNNWINQPRNLNIGVDIDKSGLARFQDGSRSKGKFVKKHDGAIDVFKGMADGGITGPNVMDVAQMVAPGDIRFAGDRSDVDEAWIPLDGSGRSRSILDEAVRRMPGYEPEGMESGGITGVISPSTVDGVEGPDTSDLTETWKAAMEELDSSTDIAFQGITTNTSDAHNRMASQIRTSGNMMVGDTTAAQSAMREYIAISQSAMKADTARSSSRMRDDTKTAQDSMQSTVSTRSSQMRDDTKSSQENMATTVRMKQAAMTSDTSRNMSDRRDTTASGNKAMRDNTQVNLEAMRSHTGTQLRLMAASTRANVEDMRASTASALGRMRSTSAERFESMRSQGIQATSQLRQGVVREIGNANTPFTSKINDLIDVMRSFSRSLNKAYGDMGVSVGTPTRLATGGILPGYSPGVDNHKFTSPTGGALELSGGESILRPEATRALGSKWVNSVNKAARYGGVGAVKKAFSPTSGTRSFAKGGILDDFTAEAGEIRDTHKANLPDSWVKPIGVSVMDDVTENLSEQLSRMMSGEGWQRPTTGRVTSRYGAGRGKYPHAGMDIAKGQGTPTVAPTFAKVVDTGWNIGPGRSGIGALLEHAANMFTYYGHNPVGGLKVKVGDTLAPGDPVGAQGNTGNSTGAHLHWEVHKGKEWADINPHPYWEMAGGGGGSVGPSGGGSDRWATVVKRALMKNGLPTSAAYTSAWLRQIQTESGGNEKARQGIVDINSILGHPAVGLLQTIPPTFRAYAHAGHGNILNGYDNALAAMAYAKARYGASGMLNVIGKGRGYEGGVNSAPPGWAWVGEAGPELLRMGGGETVRTSSASSRMASDNQRITRADAKRIAEAMAEVEGGNVIIENMTAYDHDEASRKIEERQRRRKKLQKSKVRP